MTWGQHEQFLSKLSRQGNQLQVRQEVPKLTPTAQPYWQAFNVLNQSRQMGPMNPNPITLNEINTYCYLFSIVDIQEKTLIVRFIQALDRVFFKILH